ncbi:MAG: FlgD immunoglobulin-like domain containing protein [Candidatus Eisenbacteria bacterium]
MDTIASGLTVPSFTDGTASPGVRYRYTVWGTTPCGPSEPSAPDTGSVPATPVAPSGFAATDSLCDRVALAWTDLSAGELGYLVFRSDTLIAVLGENAEAYEDTAAAAGSSHAYTVGAYNPCDTLFAAVDTGKVRPAPPDPLAVNATLDLCGTIRVTWQTAAGDYDSWVVYREEDSLATVLRGGAPLHDDFDAPPGSLLVYTVRGRSECGSSAGAVSDAGFRIGVPPSPDSCIASDDRCADVEITWVPGAGPGVVDSFVIYRDDVVLGVRTEAPYFWLDTTGDSEQWYRYRVVAWNSCDSSAAASADSGRRGAVPPTPSGVAATDGLCDSVVITWNAVAGPFTEYAVFRDGEEIGTVPIDSPAVFIDGAVDSMVAASYGVRTRSECGISEASTPNEGMRVGLPPPTAACSASDNRCGVVFVHWSIPSEPGVVDSFLIFRDGVRVGVETDTFFVDSAATPNVPHRYGVRSRNECGLSVSACEDSGTMPTAPGPVDSFTASKDRCETIRLEWAPPSTGGPPEGFRIVRSSPPGGTITLGPEQTVYNDYGLSGLEEVVYTIRAFNCEESAAVTDTGRLFTSPPPPPSSCTATPVSCSAMRIAWSAGAEAAFGHLVYRDGGTLVDSVGPDSLALTDGAASPGVDHEWRVFSVNDCGRSAAACTVAARIPGPIGPAPGGACAATTSSCDGIRLTWTWVHPEIEWFRIRRVEDGALLDSVAAGVSSFIDPSPAFGDTVAYSVEAGNACFVSTSSCTASGIRPALPSAPQQCSASDGLCGRITVSWLWPPEYINQNILGFRVYRQRSDQPSAPPDTFTVGPRFGPISIEDDNVVPGVSYFYRVVTYNQCGETSGGCQSPGSATSVPGTPVLVSPADGAHDLPVPLRLRWKKRARATSYRVEIARDSAFADPVVNAVVTDTSYNLAEVDSIGEFRWRVSGRNVCGEGAASETRRFAIAFVPGLEVTSGTSFIFGNGSDSTYADSILVLQNFWFNSLAWSIDDTLSWVALDPAAGNLASGEVESVTASIGPHRCGVVLAGSLLVVSDPLLSGKEPIPLFVSLDPERRPVGDVNWDCRLDVEDGARIVDALLGEKLSPSDSAGADGNGDGRINVADVVFLAGLLAAEEPAEGPVIEGAFDLDFAPGSARVVRLRTGFALRAVRLVADLSGGRERGAGAADGSGGIVRYDAERGRASAFWFSAERGGADEALLLRVEGTDPVVTPRWIEVAGVRGERIRMSLQGTDLAAGPPPARVAIEGIVPNPFNPRTTVRFALPAKGRATVRVHDVRGARVRTLTDEVMKAGRHEVVWEGRNDGGREAASGVYFVRVETAEGAATARMVLIR